MQRATEVGTVIGQDADLGPAPQHEQAQVAELAADRAAVRELVDPAQFLPADPGQVTDGLGVARARTEPQGQVAAEIAADGGGGQAARGQQLAGPPKPPTLAMSDALNRVAAQAPDTACTSPTRCW